MSELKGACIIGQSGGPTSVINASAYGVIRTALDSGCITNVYGAEHGIKGVLEDRLFDMSQEDPKELELLKYTPSSALGSCRYKMKDPDEDDTDYKRILEVFKKHDVRYFFYNGGNDSMDTCNKISKYMQKVGYECRVMGVPKTIDNDLYGTDHCPGYASAAKYIATSLMEVYQDAHVYDTGMICIVEIMGRHAGWLTAAAALATKYGAGPDLIYLPETDFDMDTFLADVERIYKETGSCMVAVSEGIHYADGSFVSEAKTSATDGFGHAQLGGLAALLASIVKERPARRCAALSCRCSSAAAHTSQARPISKRPSWPVVPRWRTPSPASPTRWSPLSVRLWTATTFARRSCCRSPRSQTLRRKFPSSGSTTLTTASSRSSSTMSSPSSRVSPSSRRRTPSPVSPNSKKCWPSKFFSKKGTDSKESVPFLSWSTHSAYSVDHSPRTSVVSGSVVSFVPLSV